MSSIYPGEIENLRIMELDPHVSSVLQFKSKWIKTLSNRLDTLTLKGGEV